MLKAQPPHTTGEVWRGEGEREEEGGRERRGQEREGGRERRRERGNSLGACAESRKTWICFIYKLLNVYNVSLFTLCN